MKDIALHSKSIAEYYDQFSNDYNTITSQWQYDAPEKVASMLAKNLPLEASVLDAGCGTGKTGIALRAVGFNTIDGIDISEESLKLAKDVKVYNNIKCVDLQSFPFPLKNDQYDALISVGVSTYLPDTANTLQEFCRIVKPQGPIIFTQRTDLFMDRDVQSVLNALTAANKIEQLRVSEPRPYLPKNEEFADKILVHYIDFIVV